MRLAAIHALDARIGRGGRRRIVQSRRGVQIQRAIARKPEVEHANFARRRDHDVARLDVGVNDAALVASNFDGPATVQTADPNRDGWVDVRDLALDVMRHRMVLTYEALSDNVSADDLLTKILDRIPVPEVPLHEHAQRRLHA